MSPFESKEKELLIRLRQDDYNAFREIYDLYWHKLMTFTSKRIQSAEDAEEIVQDVFVKFYQRRLILNITSSLEAYLFQAARFRIYNKYRDYIRQKKNLEILHLDDFDFPINEEYSLEYKQTEQLVNQAINKLPEKCKKVYNLSRNSSLTNRQVAEKLGISINTVEKHIGRALKILRTELESTLPLPLVYILMDIL